MGPRVYFCIRASGSRGAAKGCITITIMEQAQFLRSASVQVMIGIYLLQNAID